MNVSEALSSRKSVRAFKADAVDKKVMMEILEKAARTPSWANSQPWTVFVAAGETLKRIREAYIDSYKNAVKTVTDIARPTEWPQAAKDRTMGLRPDMVRDCGEAADQFGELNQRMFDAPAVIFLCVDKLYSPWALYDLGAYSQSVMLLAQERGLSTIPAITSVAYPDVLRKELKIPDSLHVAIGIPIGYADDTNAINKLHTLRDSAETVVRFTD